MLSRAAVIWKHVRRPPATREDRNIRHLMLHTSLFGVVNGGVITFLPILLARLGASAVTISLLTSLPALLTIACALPAGTVVARWRHLVGESARCFYAIRLAYPPIAAAAVLVSPSVAPLLIVVLWGLTAIPGTVGNTAFYDVVAEAVPARRRAAVNGVRWALLGMVSAVSVWLFGQMLEAMPWPRNYLLLFAICFAAGLLSTSAYSRLEIPPREPASAPPARVPLRARARELLQPLRAGTGFLTLSAVSFVLRVGFFLPAGVFSLFLVRNLAASDALIGSRTMVENSALTLGYYLWGRLANRLGHARMLTLAALAVGLALVLTGLTTPQSLWLLFVAALIAGFFVSAVDVSLFEWLLAVMPPEDRPRYVAMNTLLLNLVLFLAPIAGAAVAERTGIPPVLFGAGACLFGSAALTEWLARRAERKLRAAA